MKQINYNVNNNLVLNARHAKWNRMHGPHTVQQPAKCVYSTHTPLVWHVCSATCTVPSLTHTHKRWVENFLLRISGSITFRKPVSRFVLLLLLHTHNTQWLVELSIKMKCMLVSFEIYFAPAWIVHTYKRFGCCGCSSAYNIVYVCEWRFFL